MSIRDLSRSVYEPSSGATPWRLEDEAGHDRLRYYSLGRWALSEALRLAGAGPGRPVLFPEFICRDALASAHLLGAAPVFYPVDRRLRLARAPSDLPDACAVVAVDYFGFPQDLAPFEEYCRRTGALLVEDAAHALFSRDAAGRLLGTRSPVGIFSLRKSLRLPDGGALALNDPSLEERAEPQLPFARRGRGRRAWARPLASLLGGPGMAGLLSLGHGARRLLKGSPVPSPEPDAERRPPLPPTPCVELSRAIVAADPSAEALRRRALYSLCADLLSPVGTEPVFEDLPEGTVPYVYAFRAEPAAASRAAEVLRRAGLFALPWPDLPASVAGRAPAHYADVWGVHFLW